MLRSSPDTLPTPTDLVNGAEGLAGVGSCRGRNEAVSQLRCPTWFSAAIQAHLDAKARERQYDGIQTAITYRGDPNPQFSAEGDVLFPWRSAVWTYSTDELTKVLARERPQPSVEEFIAELPAFEFEWP
jgi:hypothetical protein